VNEDCLELTAYFGERDRIAGRFPADALIDVYARHELRLLSLSEDLPLAAAGATSLRGIWGYHGDRAHRPLVPSAV
jgi:PII-like signaling protein